MRTRGQRSKHSGIDNAAPLRQASDTMRETTPRLLAKHLTDTHAALLRLWEAWRPALAPSGWKVRYLPELSPPLWELGHLAWAEETWLGRNPLRGVATSAEATHATDPSRPAAGPALPARAPAAVRGASLLPRADAWFDPDRVSPTRRWHLDLPSPARLRTWSSSSNCGYRRLGEISVGCNSTQTVMLPRLRSNS